MRLSDNPIARLQRPRVVRYSLLLALLLIGVAAAVAVSLNLTQAQSANGVYDTDGDGLIEISNLEQLGAVRYDLNGDGTPDDSANGAPYAAAFSTSGDQVVCETGCSGYELVNNLDFGTTDLSRNWLPIGDRRNAFVATFDGSGHTISNLRVGRLSTDLVGLFGHVGDGGAIRRVRLESVDIAGRSRVGSLAGYNDGDITSSYATGFVAAGDDYAGGLVGYNEGNITGTYAGASVSGNSSVGGLVGRNKGRTLNSYATGKVDGRGAFAGGLAGNNEDGSITASYATGKVDGQRRVGGLVGYYYGTEAFSYWDTETSGLGTSYGGEGKTTEELQSPTSNTGIYAEWNPDLWDFGTGSQYPALKADMDGDRVATAWEFGEQGRTPPPAPTPTPTHTPTPTRPPEAYVDFSIGVGHICLLRNDGVVICDGDDTHGQASPPESGARYVELDGGDTHTCGLKEDGEVECWGSISGTFDKDAPPVAPTPTPTPTPGPTTPQPTTGPAEPGADSCVDTLSANGSVIGEWASGCDSTARAGSHARFYSFTLSEDSEVTITLELRSGEADTYLYLREGENTRSGDFLHENDDEPDTNRSEIRETLPAGTYTIEATTYEAGQTGSFTLTVSGL